MNRPRSILTAVFVFSLVLAGAVAAAAQPEARQQVEPSYEVSLHLLVGSNDAGPKADLPANLANISRQLKGTFPFSNYHLASTLIGRVSNNGSFEYKSVGNVLGQATTPGPPTFLEWTLANFRTMQMSKGTPGFQAQSFRFGARVPLTTASFKDESGKMNPVINYESIGVSISKIGMPENAPTLIGTLHLPGSGGTMFLVMTVRSADL